MKGYITTNELADFMGMSFNTAQATIAGLSIGAAEEWIDNTIKHAWKEIGPITEDVLIGRTTLLRVSKPPVKAITSVSAIWWPDHLPVLLQPDCGAYHVRSLRDGVIWVPRAAGFYAARFVYVPNDDPVPDDVRLATMALAGANLRMTPVFMDDVDPTIVQSYVVGGELEVVFRKNILTTGAAAQQALSYLEAWTKGYTFV